MSEELLGYLLGALEPEEAAAVEARLESDPALRRELVELALLLKPLSTDELVIDPPQGLRHRVCDSIAAASQGAAAERTPVGAAAVAPSPRPGMWSRLDAAAFVGISIAAAVLLVPVLASNHYRAQSVACRQRMGEIGRALVGYSRTHRGLFPEVATDGSLAHAGVYAVKLHDAGYLPDERAIYCPAVLRDDEEPPQLPTAAVLAAADPAAAKATFTAMDGAYGYALGYVEDGRYRPLRNLDRSTFAVLADSPQDHGGGGRNHGCGQNVWFEDGHVEFLNCSRLNVRDDDLYENDEGFVGAGIGADDVVIGAASASPRLEPVEIDATP